MSRPDCDDWSMCSHGAWGVAATRCSHDATVGNTEHPPARPRLDHPQRCSYPGPWHPLIPHAKLLMRFHPPGENSINALRREEVTPYPSRNDRVASVFALHLAVVERGISLGGEQTTEVVSHEIVLEMEGRLSMLL